MPHMPYSWPPLILGVLVATYWGRVLRMVRKARHKGRDANLLPAERLGQVLRILWTPVILAWIACPLLVAFWASPSSALRPLYHNPWIGWPAAVVGVLAFAATWACWKKMGKSWRMGIDPQGKTGLIVTGPYAYVRHPIYALSSLLMSATVVAVPSPMMIVVGAAHLLLLQWEARREERYLIRLHGPAYANYRARVGRFLPRSLVGYSAGQ